MAINNCICETCNHVLVCANYKNKISVFSDDAKVKLGIDITINSCVNYQEAE